MLDVGWKSVFFSCGISSGVTVIFLLVVSSIASISEHCFLVVPVTGEVAVEPKTVESEEDPGVATDRVVGVG